MTKAFSYTGLVAIIAFLMLFTNNRSWNKNGEFVKNYTMQGLGTAHAANESDIDTTGENVIGSQPFVNPVPSDAGSRECLVGYINEEYVPGGAVYSCFLDEKPTDGSIVWLEYDLFGVSDYSGISKSVNDQLSCGGYFVTKNDSWSHQKEKLHIDAVRKGLNTIRFSTADQAKYSYRVKNIRLHIEEFSPERRIVLNTTGQEYYDNNKAYVQGFVHGNGSCDAEVWVNGVKTETEQGQFENMADVLNTGENEISEVQIEARFEDGEIIKEKLVFNEKSEYDLSYPLEHATSVSKFFCNPASSFSICHGGISLQGAEGDINSMTTISAMTLRKKDMTPLEEGMENVTGMGSGYRMLPHGVLFNKEIEIRIKYDPSQIPVGYSPEDIYTYYFDEENSSWVVLDRVSVDTVQNEIVSKTNHFTDFINGVIKAPEMPEVSAYTPTSITDLKVADPLAGVALISAPSANNMGSATTGLSIEVPAGRAGMQPGLSIQYSSQGGNGWMGLGWNIQVPEISVETRWGVPRYDAINETESYLYAGEELTPQVQRSNYVARGTASEKQFYPRVEGAFNKIVRHGTNPTNYYWTVTDKGGTVYYFGETSESRISTSLGIARWELSRIEDVNGNSVIYQYETKTWSAPGTIADGGKQIYLKKIIYTCSGTNINGAYSVNFNLENPATVQREDLQVSYRYGFKEVTGHRLSNVVVNSNWGEVSRYVMTYITGEFGKSLLSQVNHFVGGSTTSVEKKYQFDYYTIDEREPFFDGSPSEIEVPDADLKTGTIFGTPTALGNSKSWLTGAGIGGGIGIGAKVYSKKNTINLNYGHDRTWTKSHSVLIDINGDGLPDKIVRDGDNVSYYKMVLSTTGELTFETTSIPITTLSHIGKEKSYSNSLGLSFHAGITENSSVNVAAGYSRTKSISQAYFSDVNNDGLIDYVDDGVVYYNNLVSNVPVFSSSQSQVLILGGCDTIYLNNEIDASMFSEDEYDPLLDRVADVVKVWIAPYSGTVVAGNIVQYGLDPSNNLSNSSEWIKFSIEYNNTIVLIDSINTQNTGNKIISATLPNVSKGDKVFFRLFDKNRINPNEIVWKCSARYSGLDTSRVDADSKKVFKYESEKDFTLTNKSLLEIPFDGQVRIHGSITAPALSDTVKMQFFKNGIIWKEKVFADNTVISYHLDTLANVDSLDQFAFKLKSNTQVEWSAVSSGFEITYLSISTIPAFNVDTTTSAGTVRFSPYLEYSLFPNDISPSVPYTFIEPEYPQLHIVFTDNTASGNLTFSIKRAHDLVDKEFYQITSGNQEVFLPGTSFPGSASLPVYFDIYSSDTNLLKKIVSAEVLFSNNTYNVGIHTIYPDTSIIFGNLNRNWGQFTYSPEIQNDPIDKSLLNLINFNSDFENAMNNLAGSSIVGNFTQNNILTGIEDVGNVIENNGATNPLNEVFGYMYLDMAEGKWKGLRGKGFVDKNKMSTEQYFDLLNVDWSDAEPVDQGNPGNIYENESLTPEDLIDDIYSPYPVVVPGSVIRAVNRVTNSNNYSLSGSIGPTILSGGLNGSISNSNQVSDFMDMNGDGYPDILSKGKIQYTSPFRDFEANSRTISLAAYDEISRNISTSGGATIGTTFSKQGPPRNNYCYKTQISGSTGAGGVLGTSEQKEVLNDVNGDGLPDYIVANGSNVYVYLNTGYGFENGIVVSSLSNPRQSNSTCLNTSLGGGWDSDVISLWENSISGGVSFTFSNDAGKHFMVDVNGDGLADKIRTNNQTNTLHVRINSGTGFYPEIEYLDMDVNFRENKTDNQGVNGAVTWGFPIWVTPMIKCIISPTANIGKSSTAVKMQIQDINNDGLADVTYSDDETILSVYYSNLGKINLLRQVTNPSDGYFIVDYAPTGCSQQSPQRTMTMASVMIYDQHSGDGADVMMNTFGYANAVYDRENRTSYGFGTVKTKQHNTLNQDIVYRVVVEKFHTDDYRFKGLKKSEEITNRLGDKFVRTYYTYVLKYISNGTEADPAGGPYCGDVYPAIIFEDKYFYEGQSNYTIHTQKKITHTSFGNVSIFEDFGDLSDANDNVKAEINYADDQVLMVKHILSLPVNINVYAVVGSTNTLVRSRSAVYDNYGRVTSIIMVNGSNYSTTQYAYDGYGNITNVTFPEDVNNEHKTLTLVYDSQVHTFPLSVTDESGYSSSTSYDYRLGVPLTTTDLAGQNMQYTYDIDGRLSTVRGPNEIASGATYTIKFEYPANGASNHNWAVTRHYNPGYTDIYTVQFADGLGRPIQTKKTATVYNSSTGLNEDKIIVSGKQCFDAFGRVDSVLYPVADAYNLSTITTLSTSVDAEPPTVMTYDILDRTTRMTNPEGDITETSYGFGTDKYSKTRFLTTMIDAKQNTTHEYKDARGLKTTVKDAMDGQTGFIYDALGLLTESSDPENYSTTYLYDMVGQLLSRNHPDAGTTSYTYDNAGHVLTTQTQNLINNNQSIEYVYSQGRLSSIEYPQNPEMNVYYQYGAAGSGNQSGRLIKQQDFSGVQTFEYGRMGELTANKRSFVLPDGTIYTFKMMWVYDSWNRVKTITYPDGDVATYSYQKGGQLNQVVTTKPTQSAITLVSSVGYDKFGSRVMLQYGNGTKMCYSFDAQSRRLSNLKSYTGALPIQQMQNISYSYDDVGNITAVSNSAAALSNGLGDEYSYTYTYDNLYRLTDASGNWKRNYCFYTMNMEYSASGRILSKYQNAFVYLNSAPVGVLRDYTYTYNGTNKPHAVRSVGTGTSADYDANGNITAYTNAPVVGTMPRELTWDEENRLSAVGDGRYMSANTYDAGGERVLKFAGAWQQMTIGGQQIINFANLNERKTLYMGGHMVLTNTNYTKHYYMGSERIHTRIGGGFLTAPVSMSDVITPLLSGSSYTALATAMTTKIRRDAELVGYDSVAMPAAFTCMATLISANGSETNRYFYHPDHLGSSSFITNSGGAAVHHMQYLPFGELFVEQRGGIKQPWYTPYKFSGKEKDEETSLSYFGARYYDSDLSVWLSVDPMSDERSWISPYNYCQWNPVGRVDPSGALDGWVDDPLNPERGTYWDESVNTESEASAKGLNYHGQTVMLRGQTTNQMRYGDQYGKIHDISYIKTRDIHGFKGNSHIDRAMENALNCGYDPQWIEDFKQFVEIGINAIEITIAAAMFGNAANRFSSIPRTIIRNSSKPFEGVTEIKPFTIKPSEKGGGLILVDNNNPHNNIRFMPGNPNSPNPAQQNPYVIFKKNGVAYDVNGNPLNSASDPSAHIPMNKFDVNKMPKFN